MPQQGAEHRNIMQMGKYYGALHLHYFFWGLHFCKYYRCSAPNMQGGIICNKRVFGTIRNFTAN